MDTQKVRSPIKYFALPAKLSALSSDGHYMLLNAQEGESGVLPVIIL